MQSCSICSYRYLKNKSGIASHRSAQWVKLSRCTSLVQHPHRSKQGRQSQLYIKEKKAVRHLRTHRLQDSMMHRVGRHTFMYLKGAKRSRTSLHVSSSRAARCAPWEDRCYRKCLITQIRKYPWVCWLGICEQDNFLAHHPRSYHAEVTLSGP